MSGTISHTESYRFVRYIESLHYLQVLAMAAISHAQLVSHEGITRHFVSLRWLFHVLWLKLRN